MLCKSDKKCIIVLVFFQAGVICFSQSFCLLAFIINVFYPSASLSLNLIFSEETLFCWMSGRGFLLMLIIRLHFFILFCILTLVLFNKDKRLRQNRTTFLRFFISPPPFLYSSFLHQSVRVFASRPW